MKKISAICLTIMCFAVAARAEMNFNLFGGLTSISMKTVNESIAAAHPQAESAIKFENGFMAGADIGFIIFQGFSIGARLEYIGAFDAAGTASYVGNEYRYTYSAGMVPVMIGLQEMIEDSDWPFSIGFGVYLGYGFAEFTEKSEETAGGNTALLKRTGGGEAAEMFVRLDYKLTDNVMINFLGGYRRANAVDMKVTEVSEGLPEKIGDVWMESYGTAKTVSFNGMYLNAGLLFKF